MEEISAAGSGGIMGDNGKVKILSTIKKDEAAFYLSELARGLLKNRLTGCGKTRSGVV